MHPPEKEGDMEETHHCIMFEEKNEKGKKHEQKHVRDGIVFQHVLGIKDLGKAPKVVYDHLNNGFKVVVREVDGEKYAVIDGPVKLGDIKWSDQDK